jgi:hypothetical protein
MLSPDVAETPIPACIPRGNFILELDADSETSETALVGSGATGVISSAITGIINIVAHVNAKIFFIISLLFCVIYDGNNIKRIAASQVRET